MKDKKKKRSDPSTDLPRSMELTVALYLALGKTLPSCQLVEYRGGISYQHDIVEIPRSGGQRICADKTLFASTQMSDEDIIRQFVAELQKQNINKFAGSMQVFPAERNVRLIYGTEFYNEKKPIIAPMAPPASPVKDLAGAHWSYLFDLLTTHGIPPDHISIIGFHYRSAFIHGFKHGQQQGVGK